jgi:adenylate kinase
LKKQEEMLNNNKRKIRLILFGPPGVGKGTQAKVLSGILNITHISTGDILRREVAEGTELGRKAKVILDSGGLVPDVLMIEMIKNFIQLPESENGFILDGFPRTVPQAESLCRLLVELEMKLTMVISMEVNPAKIVERLSNRVACRKCGTIYNLLSDKLADQSKCGKCGGELFQREDDKPEIISKRLNVYESMTAPVKYYYVKLGVLRTVDASGPIESVTQKILSMIQLK